MDVAGAWRIIDTERASLAELFEGLSDEQWETPSLCAGWRMRELAAHLGSGPNARWGPILREAVRARGSFDRLVDNVTKDAARAPRDEIMATLNGTVGSRRLAPGQKLSYALLDVLVHGQDLAIPLGIERPMPPTAARDSAELTWRMGRPFHARKRLRGYRLVATDLPWTAGDGPEIRGPIAALLLLVTGRPAALPTLTGPGVAHLSAQPT
ncbi:maleylpyruvate isomerase family mycothiol-dependent enzyme [Actinocorallia lasiicapitis]